MTDPQWRTLDLDAEGFTSWQVLQAKVRNMGRATLGNQIGDAPAVRVLISAHLGGQGPRVLSFQETHDGERELEATLRINKDDLPRAPVDVAPYLGKVGFLVKRPGNPFPHMIAVGRAPNCDLTFSVPTVSKMHGYFLFQEGTWSLVDQRSTNGSFVGDAQLPAGTPHVLRDGDLIRLGDKLSLEFLMPESLLDRLGGS